VATFAQVRAERKRALQAVRKQQRSLDTQVERMERTLFRLLDRKTVLEYRDAHRLGLHYSDILAEIRRLEQALVDFNVVVNG